jgi:hypothetical protein
MMENQQTNSGLFVPTTNIIEIEQIQQEGLSKELLKNIFVHLYQDMCNIALALNAKDSGYFPLEEFVSGKLLFVDPNTTIPSSSSLYGGRAFFRTVVNFGPLPDTTTLSYPHNIDIDAGFSFVNIYGCASNQIALTYVPIPYASASEVANNIELSVDSTNVYITTGIDQSAYTTTYVILEYVKE